jgi:hypothetical protein
MDWLFLYFYSAEDYSGRGVLKSAVEDTGLTSDVEPKRKRHTPYCLSPSSIQKPEPDER